MRYAIAPSDARVEVQIELTGESDGDTELGLGRWAAVEDPSVWIDAVTAATVTGEPLAVTASRSERPPAARWTVAHAPGARFVLRYAVAPPRPETIDVEDQHIFPRISASLFRGVGNLLLLEPLGDAWLAPRRIGWRFVVPEGTSVACSFGNAREGEVETTLDDFRHAFFSASPELRWLVDDEGDRDLRLAISGGWSFADDDLLEAVGAVLRAQTELVSDRHAAEQAPFVVSFAPYTTPPRGYSFGGTGLTDSFLAVASPQASLDTSEKGGRLLLHLLAHEMFHEINGRRIRRESPEQLVYWFSEGFTELMAHRSLVRAGLYRPEQAEEAGQRLLDEYRDNPARETPNEALVAGFWGEPGLRRLPYQRGFVVGLWLDRLMRAHSQGARGIDDFMQAVLEAADERGEKVSVDRLLARIEAETDAADAQAIREVVVEGAMPPPEAFAHLGTIFR
ncbi:MAG: hypothetical protein KC731_23955 [Myxococcales bacterium]|nr:hypothetical protein [Myxococcales bacterium]